jgi:signal peptidase I
VNSSKSNNLRRFSKCNKISLAIFIAVFLLLTILAVQKRYKIVFQTDYSVNFSYGYMDQKDRIPIKGEYYGFIFKAGKNNKYGMRFVKKVTCVSGERLTHLGRDFYCNGHFLGRAKVWDKSGNPAGLFDFNGIIPDRKFFAMGEHQDSYDSRYWGFVDYSWILGKIHRIF